MFNKTLHRPMFRKGGSTGSKGTGITSGLQAPRQGYAEPDGPVQKIDPYQTMRDRAEKAYPTSSSNKGGDFFIDFGLDLVSRPSTGNLLTDVGSSGKVAYDKYGQLKALENKNQRDRQGAYLENLINKSETEDAFEKDKQLIRLESELNPKLKKVFREEIPEVRINNYAASLEESDIDMIKNNSMEIATDIVGFNVFKEKNPNSAVANKNFRGVLPFEYDTKGKVEPNYSSFSVGQVFYNPEDGLFYERIAEEGIIGTDFKALDPFTYE